MTGSKIVRRWAAPQAVFTRYTLPYIERGVSTQSQLFHRNAVECVLCKVTLKARDDTGVCGVEYGDAAGELPAGVVAVGRKGWVRHVSSSGTVIERLPEWFACYSDPFHEKSARTMNPAIACASYSLPADQQGS